jgi:hypothetical protein
MMGFGVVAGVDGRCPKKVVLEVYREGWRGKLDG